MGEDVEIRLQIQVGMIYAGLDNWSDGPGIGEDVEQFVSGQRGSVWLMAHPARSLIHLELNLFGLIKAARTFEQVFGVLVGCEKLRFCRKITLTSSIFIASFYTLTCDG